MEWEEVEEEEEVEEVEVDQEEVDEVEEDRVIIVFNNKNVIYYLNVKQITF